MTTNQDTLSQFLTYTPGQEEISLVVVSDDSKKQQTEQEIEKEGFVKTHNFKELLNDIEKGGSFYLSVSADDDFKKIYDIVVQYPMKQIRIMDQQTGKEKRIAPDYANLSVIVLMSQNTLSKFKEKGFNILSKSGITYQTN